MKRYTAKGIVWGNCWGGGKCGYASEVVTGSTMEEVEKEATRQLESGELDSGMGFESLYAATLTVKVEDIREIDGKEFIHTEHENLFIGQCTENEIDAYYEA